MGLTLLVLSALSLASTLLVLAALARQGAALRLDEQLRALPRPADLGGLPRVSPRPQVTIVVPVRNEERNVGPLLRALLQLDHPAFEVLLADDASTDRTLEVAREVAGGDARVRILDMQQVARDERAAFKSGKAFVLAQAAREAQGEWLLFLDADTRQRPDALWRALELCRLHGLQAFSSSGVYVNPSLWGEVLEATLYVALFLSIPLRRVNDPADRDVGWANGQFVLVRRDVYERLGGHGALRAFAQDDLAIGRLFKERDVPFRFCPDGRLYECVNYVTWDEADRGWTRLVAAGTPWLGHGRPFFLRTLLLLLLSGLVPVIVCPLAWAGPWGLAAVGPVTARALASAALGLALFLQAAVRLNMKLSLWRTVLLPVGTLLTARVLLAAWRVRFSGAGYDLRGRTLTPDDPGLIRRELDRGDPQRGPPDPGEGAKVGA